MVREPWDERAKVCDHPKKLLKFCLGLQGFQAFDVTGGVRAHAISVVHHPKEHDLWCFDNAVRAVEHFG